MQHKTFTLFDDNFCLCHFHLITIFNYYVGNNLFDSIFYLLNYLLTSLHLVSEWIN